MVIGANFPRATRTSTVQEDIDKALLDAAESLGLSDAQIEEGKDDPAKLGRRWYSPDSAVIRLAT